MWKSNTNIFLPKPASHLKFKLINSSPGAQLQLPCKFHSKTSEERSRWYPQIFDLTWKCKSEAIPEISDIIAGARLEFWNVVAFNFSRPSPRTRALIKLVGFPHDDDDDALLISQSPFSLENTVAEPLGTSSGKRGKFFWFNFVEWKTLQMLRNLNDFVYNLIL